MLKNKKHSSTDKHNNKISREHIIKIYIEYKFTN